MHVVLVFVSVCNLCIDGFLYSWKILFKISIDVDLEHYCIIVFLCVMH